MADYSRRDIPDKADMGKIMSADVAAKQQFPYAITVQEQQGRGAQTISDAVPRLPDYVKPGDHTYNTDLGKDQELKFQAWVKENNVPFDVAAPVSDYDMRGFYKALQAGDEKAKEALNPNDKQMHFPDYWKTPYHKSFSAESQWADPKKAPRWNEQDQLVMPDGRVVFDEKKEALERTMKKQEENKKQVDMLQKITTHPNFGAVMQGQR